MVFFSGHGSPSGFLFGVKEFDDAKAKPTEINWGNKDLEWIALDACNVLERDGVFDRWGWPVFKGLHYILSFHTTTSDEPDRGHILAQYLNARNPVAAGVDQSVPGHRRLRHAVGISARGRPGHRHIQRPLVGQGFRVGRPGQPERSLLRPRGVLKEHPMSVKINFPETPRVPAELPVYAAVPPAWDAERVAEFGAQIGVRGDVTDAGVWFVLKDGKSTLGVTRPASRSASSRTTSTVRAATVCTVGWIERGRSRWPSSSMACSAAPIGGPICTPSPSWRCWSRPRKNRARTPGRRVAGQSSLRRGRHAARGTWRKGASHRRTGRGLAQAYRFWREVKQSGTRQSVPAEQAFERFAATDQFAALPDSARVNVASVQVKLGCLSPTEAQGILVPTYVLRGEVATESLPRYQFVSFRAAAEIEQTDAKKRRWRAARPALLVA